MVAGISSAALYAPIIAANAVFSPRRLSRGVEALGENPIYGLANIDISAAQTLKGARAMGSIAPAVGTTAQQAASTTANAVKNIGQSSKFLRGVGKVVDFTADNINPIICVTSGIKVLNAENKTEATAREIVSLGCMFAAEGAAKRIIGMPYTKKINGKIQTFCTEGLYTKSEFLKKNVDKFVKFCETTKIANNTTLKCLPAILKGLAFVGASIAGYKLGEKINNKLFGENPESKEQKTEHKNAA